MRYLPVFLDVAGRPCLVVGGADVAARRVETLLATGARVVTIAPQFTPAIERLAEAPAPVHLVRREYRAGDLDGMRLVFAATGDETVAARVAADAARAGVWCNLADRPELCSFVMPAILERGPVTVAVGTGGASPALAVVLRDEIATRLGPEVEAAAEHLALLRRRYEPGLARQDAFTGLIEQGLLEALRAHDAARVEELTQRACAGLLRRAAQPHGEG